MELSIGTTRQVSRRRNVRRMLSILAWPARVLEARRVMMQLGQMDRHELKDIGLSPQDLNDVAALSLAADPTELLARRVRERRTRG